MTVRGGLFAIKKTAHLCLCATAKSSGFRDPKEAKAATDCLELGVNPFCNRATDFTSETQHLTPRSDPIRGRNTSAIPLELTGCSATREVTVLP